MKKIFIPYQITGVGGPMTFVRQLSQHLQATQYQVVHTFQPDFDVLLVIEKCPSQFLRYAKAHGKKIIQRLDGIYHPGLPDLKRYIYPWKNRRLKAISNYWADHIVYQSEYSRYCCQLFLGQPKVPSSIIYNGTHIPTTLEPRQSAHTPPRLITYANFRRVDQIVPIIEALKLYPHQFELDVYGPYTRRLRSIFVTLPPGVQYRGLLPKRNLNAVFSQYDIYLFSDHSTCPNAVIEALASGLPVVAYNRGSIPELVTHQKTGYVVPLAAHDPFKKPYAFTAEDYRHFCLALTAVLQDWLRYHTLARTEAHNRFRLGSMVEAYEKIF
jgi:glycosyltransferase involved in cell wall biosynthesis